MRVTPPSPLRTALFWPWVQQQLIFWLSIMPNWLMRTIPMSKFFSRSRPLWLNSVQLYSVKKHVTTKLKNIKEILIIFLDVLTEVLNTKPFYRILNLSLLYKVFIGSILCYRLFKRFSLQLAPRDQVCCHLSLLLVILSCESSVQNVI